MNGITNEVAAEVNLSRTSVKWLFVLRVAMGWLMLYAGLTKIFDPVWSAAGYLNNAKTFTAFFQWLASPANIGWINFVNEWGLALLGISLILGAGARLSSILGAVLMVFYYLPVLQFPYIASHSFIVDEHIIYALVLIFFAAVRAGRYYGLDARCANWPICRRYPKIHRIFS